MAQKKAPPSWQTPVAESQSPAASVFPLEHETAEDFYSDLENPKTTAFLEATEAIAKGQAVVDDAILFCGRFNVDGMLLRENQNEKPYRLVHCRNNKEYSASMREADQRWKDLNAKLREANVREDFFTSSSDIGSNLTNDPNQYTEFTPYFNGPFAKQQYFDYFKGHARAFQAWNHNPIARRIINILTQYTVGRGFKIIANDDNLEEKWREFDFKFRITYNIRKYWLRELLIYGENFIDVMRWISVDPSTIYDIICEGYGEYINKVLYYQQMFQTATQTYAGQDVPGVKGSKDSKVGRFIIRQIPYDQIIHIKDNVTSVEKRGRSVLYSVLGWLKRLTDILEARALGEQLRASFVWDDEVDGDQAAVDAHGSKYNYIPVEPSLFVHNKTVVRKPLAPMAGVSGNGTTDVVNEILAIIASGMGIQKDQFNILVSSGSRATAIVGSEPFTKVIEDLQEDANDLLHQIIEKFCEQNNFNYEADNWKVIFPSVVKDSTGDRLKDIATCETMDWFSKERAAIMAAAEMEQDEYDYDEEQEKIKNDQAANAADDSGLPLKPPLPPVGRLGKGSPPSDANPLHNGKADVIVQHKKL